MRDVTETTNDIKPYRNAIPTHTSLATHSHFTHCLAFAFPPSHNASTTVHFSDPAAFRALLLPPSLTTVAYHCRLPLPLYRCRLPLSPTVFALGFLGILGGLSFGSFEVSTVLLITGLAHAAQAKARLVRKSLLSSTSHTLPVESDL